MIELDLPTKNIKMIFLNSSMLYGLIGALLLGPAAYFLFEESFLAGTIGALVGYGLGDHAEKHHIGQATPDQVKKEYSNY